MNNLGYISVDKLIDFANNHINKTIVANDIARFPRADVEEVRHGEDIYYTVCDKHCEFKCSVCNAWIGVVEGGTLDAARGFNYCPACGAKMDGGKDSIDTTT